MQIDELPRTQVLFLDVIVFRQKQSDWLKYSRFVEKCPLSPPLSTFQEGWQIVAGNTIGNNAGSKQIWMGNARGVDEILADF